jgi:hypothetical protein
MFCLEFLFLRFFGFRFEDLTFAGKVQVDEDWENGKFFWLENVKSYQNESYLSGKISNQGDVRVL